MKNVFHLKKEIRDFAMFLMKTANKWNDKEWVQGQYDSHVEECADLRKRKDKHLQAELLDKVIIAYVITILYEGHSEKAYRDPKSFIVLDDNLDELVDDVLENGIVEFETFKELFDARTEKFKSKLHLDTRVNKNV